jgi:hypothetical protein
MILIPDYVTYFLWRKGCVCVLYNIYIIYNIYMMVERAIARDACDALSEKSIRHCPEVARDLSHQPGLQKSETWEVLDDRGWQKGR